MILLVLVFQRIETVSKWVYVIYIKYDKTNNNFSFTEDRFTQNDYQNPKSPFNNKQIHHYMLRFFLSFFILLLFSLFYFCVFFFHWFVPSNCNALFLNWNISGRMKREIFFLMFFFSFFFAQFLLPVRI